MENKVVEAEVLTNEAIAENIMKMTMLTAEVADRARPGQFVNVYPEADRLILPRPISICDANPEERTLTLVYAVVGGGTRELSEAKYGQVIRLSTPLGKGFKIVSDENVRSAVLIGGGVGIAPMVLLAKELSRLGIRCTAVAGFKKETFLIEELREYDCRIIATTEIPTETTFVGNVVDCLEINEIRSRLYFACGPRPMLSAVSRYVYGTDPGAELQVSLEERMGCGYGVCVGCVCDVKSKDGDGQDIIVKKKVCKDGPVFNGNEVVW